MNGPDSGVVQARILNIIRGPWQYCALLAFTQLGIPGHLDTVPATTGELAARCNADPDALGRLLRCCASLGVVAATPAGRWALTVEGAALRAGGSMRAAVLANSGPPAWGAMLILGAAVRSASRCSDRSPARAFMTGMPMSPGTAGSSSSS